MLPKAPDELLEWWSLNLKPIKYNLIWNKL